MKSVVQQRVLLGKQTLRHCGRVVVTHDEAGGIAPRDELIHFPAVDLILLLIKAMDGVASELVGGHIVCRIEGAHGQIGGESLVWSGWIQGGVDWLRKGFIRFVIHVNLIRGWSGSGNAVGSWKRSV